MTLIEAIKSGKKYRRAKEVGWYHPLEDYAHYSFKIDQIMADDWEVQPEVVTITREQLEQAWMLALGKAKTAVFTCDLLAEALGL